MNAERAAPRPRRRAAACAALRARRMMGAAALAALAALAPAWAGAGPSGAGASQPEAQRLGAAPAQSPARDRGPASPPTGAPDDGRAGAHGSVRGAAEPLGRRAAAPFLARAVQGAARPLAGAPALSQGAVRVAQANRAAPTPAPTPDPAPAARHADRPAGAPAAQLPAQSRQGFAGLGEAAEGFAPVVRGTRLVFPRDHGAHPRHRIEWWYLTANLTAEDGAELGVQWTLFRQALAPEGPARGWATPQLWMGHAAATSAGAHRFAQKLARGGVGVAGVTAEPFAAWIDDWRLAARGPGMKLLEARASGEGFAYELELRAEGPPVLHGDEGWSLKSAQGQASHYVSLPFLSAEGWVAIDGRRMRVRGRAWMDHEWSSRPLSADQKGWDWFSIHFDDGARLMLFALRGADGAFLSGSWIAPDGAVQPLGPDEIRMTALSRRRVAGRALPLRWRLELPRRGLRIETAPLNPEAWMAARFAYWEGPIRVSGTRTGRGYMELTGY
ncbi:lipocalin-like domain-containing protein [Oceanicella actignis]|uniref:Predicted secreted hydrolase n=1 Tax=Oceanicella actignis TaxID=1189325 RepID=A0A1M7SH67_9RHOB|nr:lipocalin-like domain-containing protein [Oceanicella actignis]SET20159.1 Predicted secreted hydrolase [Oceanicella actignis]SHN57791.1 Predicted secreted hydrolase [Oceanicella actignis]